MGIRRGACAYTAAMRTVALVTAVAATGHDDDLVPLLDACADAGLHARAVAWDDPTVNWGRFDTVLLRSPWDYTERLPEFVFDHAWAHAYARYGLDYYPKWLCAVPYSPVTGPRLLAQDAAHRKALLTAVRDEVLRLGLSSAHVNFHAEDEDDAFASDWLPRIDVQYHWRNPGHWRDFDGFLADFDHKHRKNIRQERAKVQRAGVVIRTVHGDEATAADLEAMFGFYLRTFQDYGNSPALTLPFLQHLARTMPRQLVMFLADHDDRTIAGALCLRGHDTLFGRYWGAEAPLPGLHFETCYYQGIAYCLREGLARFEPGAQGEHKIARGFLPAWVRSRHWIADPEFAGALANWCDEESQAVRRYARTLQSHSPFKQQDRA